MELIGRVLGALKKLRPQQQNTGAGSIQVGRAGGAVKVVQQGDVTHHHVRVVHQHFYGSLPGPSLAPPPPPSVAVAASPRHVSLLTDVHREVLSLMEPLPKRTRIAVLDFMSREFGTRMVKELDTAAVHRVRSYVRQVRANRAREVRTHELL